jgi:aminoglycoside phosphotransferase (APT) family kinase protein
MAQDDPCDAAPIDVDLVQRLVADQFPKWAHLPIRPVKTSGHDNRTFRLGPEMSVRIPSAHRYAAYVETEQLWLPKLAPHLPLPIPTPLALGKPAHGYPWAWSVNKWLDGESASIERVNDLSLFASDLANFLNRLRTIDAADGPSPGPDNFYRGGDLAVYDDQVRECIDELQGVVDPKAATAVWESALNAAGSGPAVWVHGDVAAGNLLVKGGRLSAVIDFGQLAVGDPACDVTIAWTFCLGASRDVFRRELSVDEATWSRGRGWGLWKALLGIRKYRRNEQFEFANARQVVDDILSE